ncbi:zinc finger protein 37 homolog isoform X3 [Periplaneta americana]|uniref:zinc finger protein 37 homolog isoform X3 n=1 Tax=Periplaneta americana TaxID=6978 RepID=UPI0037E7B108
MDNTWRPWENNDNHDGSENSCNVTQDNGEHGCANIEASGESVERKSSVKSVDKRIQGIVCYVHDSNKTRVEKRGAVVETAKVIKLSRQTVSEILNRGPKNQPKFCKLMSLSSFSLPVAMDVIKMEHEVDPLERNSLNQPLTKIKADCEDHGYDLTSQMKLEEAAVPINTATMKYEAEEELCDVDTVKEELLLEAATHEGEVIAEGFPDIHDSAVSSECKYVALEDYVSRNLDLSNSVSSAKIVRTLTYEKRFKCDLCEKYFSHAASLKRHVLKHTSNTSYKCNICGRSFFDEDHLNRHTRVHTGEKAFKCDVCGMCFSQPSYIIRHKRRHTGEKPFKCDVCGKCFSQTSHLICHKRQHTGEKPFKCEICGKCFSESGNHMKHERQHTGEKPFKCEDCGKCFSQSRSLKIHERQHTGEKPFKCDTCEKCFTHKGNLKSHVLKHTN